MINPDDQVAQGPEEETMPLLQAFAEHCSEHDWSLPFFQARGASGGPERARALLMEHLARFYDFKDLLRWKKKFDPAFEDRYLVYPDPLALPRAVLAIIRAQSPGGMAAYFSRRHGHDQGPQVATE